MAASTSFFQLFYFSLLSKIGLEMFRIHQGSSLSGFVVKLSFSVRSDGLYYTETKMVGILPMMQLRINITYVDFSIIVFELP
jgi:hypothetical protein